LLEELVVARLHQVPSTKVIDDIAANLGNATVDDLRSRIVQRYRKVDSYDFVRLLAKDAALADACIRKRDATAEAQRRAAKAPPPIEYLWEQLRKCERPIDRLDLARAIVQRSECGEPARRELLHEFPGLLNADRPMFDDMPPPPGAADTAVGPISRAEGKVRPPAVPTT